MVVERQISVFQVAVLECEAVLASLSPTLVVKINIRALNINTFFQIYLTYLCNLLTHRKSDIRLKTIELGNFPNNSSTSKHFYKQTPKNFPTPKHFHWQTSNFFIPKPEKKSKDRKLQNYETSQLFL